MNDVGPPSVRGESGYLQPSCAAGSVIAGYRACQVVGQGGMAEVFLAHDGRLRRQVAVRILAPALATDAAFRHRFIGESRAAAAVEAAPRKFGNRRVCWNSSAAPAEAGFR